MIVCGHWEQSYNTPDVEVWLWNLPLRDFGVHDWRMWPVTGVKNNEPISLTEYDSFHGMLDSLPDLPRVYLEPAGAQTARGVWLHEYQHPDDCIYIFGSAHFNPVLSGRRPVDTVVTIPTVENKGVPWPHQCLMVVLYDRLVKSWQ